MTRIKCHECEAGNDVSLLELIDIEAIESAARRGKFDDALWELEAAIPELADFCDRLRRRLELAKTEMPARETATAVRALFKGEGK